MMQRTIALFLGITAGAACDLLSVPAMAATECNSWLFGICIGHNTPAEQAVIDANRRLKIILENPVQAPPVLERRLRQLIRYANGVIRIEDPYDHTITTISANTPWSVVCDPVGSITVVFNAATRGNGNFIGESGELIAREQSNGIEVELVPFEVLGAVNFDKNYCSQISVSLGQSVRHLTSGQ